MNLLERVVTLLRANLNTVVERSDDPEKTLHQLQLDMHNQLMQVKTEVAKAIAESHVLQKRSEAQKAEADTWLKKAEQAVQQGKDEKARTALVHYNNTNKIVKRYQEQKKEQEQLVITMRAVLQKLEDKITDVESTIELLEARKRNALIQQRVYDALNKVNYTPGSTAPAQDALLDAEARARAQAELEQRDLEQQLNDISAEQGIEKQLQHLKTHRLRRSNSPSQSEHTRSQQRGERQPYSRQQNPDKIQTGPLVDPLSSPLLQRRDGHTTHRSERQHNAQAQQAEELSTERDLNLDYLKKLLEQAPENTN
jgi:Phage shock protein A (IM30), suppresses sigma54-dependent transcription